MTPDRAAARLLALIALALALMTLWAALAWRRAHEENLCWRSYVEDGEHPPEGDCRR